MRFAPHVRVPLASAKGVSLEVVDGCRLEVASPDRPGGPVRVPLPFPADTATARWDKRSRELVVSVAPR